MKRILGILMAAVVAAILVLCLAAQAGAQRKAHAGKVQGRQTTVTDAGGRTHVRPAPRITEAQRKAAARHREAFRVRAAQEKALKKR